MFKLCMRSQWIKYGDERDKNNYIFIPGWLKEWKNCCIFLESEKGLGLWEIYFGNVGLGRGRA